MVMEKKSKLKEACFSKRCQRLFKKASEFCHLTGIQIDMIAFSPAGRPYNLEKIGKKFKVQEDTFSKRCQTLFKKAKEFSLLTGSRIDMVAFSPTGRPYSLGPLSSSMETVLHHYLNGKGDTAIPSTVNVILLRLRRCKKKRGFCWRINEIKRGGFQEI